MELSGNSLIGQQPSPGSGNVFYPKNPATGEILKPAYHSATEGDLEKAAGLAADAFSFFSTTSGADRSRFLRQCALELESLGERLIDRAMQETGLPEQRIKAELGRTAGQMHMFASLIEEGSWCRPRIDHADPERQPIPKPDIRSMLEPLGPVAVFGASNFPLAFSVAGGDTASAFAAGCPVIVKAHAGHPGTSEQVGRALQKAVRHCRLPEGVFSMLFDAGTEIGAALVAHPEIRAVGFTGSQSGGKALMHIAASREFPIPVYAEMGSIDPVVYLPESLGLAVRDSARALASSVTLGVGQFCTNPGLVMVPDSSQGQAFIDELRFAILECPPGVMLNERIHRSYLSGIQQFAELDRVDALSRKQLPEQPGCYAHSALFVINADTFLTNPVVSREVFGPSTVVVRYGDPEQLLTLVNSLEGQLTGSLHGDEAELSKHRRIADALRAKVGRLIFNGYPTGVEVCPSMVHGGPFPASSDGRYTSVGTFAIERFCRSVAYQNCPDAMLPEPLQEKNPLGLWRLVDGAFKQ